jgi:ATP-dependent Clp protease ATP-binding subunit ClpA
LSDEARKWLVENGYDQAMGARPMARLIQSAIKTPLADEVLFGRLKHGGTVRVIVTADDAGVRKLGFVYPDGPLLPRPEKMVEEASKRPARRKTAKKMARAKAPVLDNEPPPRASGRSSVPKVPLKS